MCRPFHVMAHFTQIVAVTDRPTQILGSLKEREILLFPYDRAGTVLCERSSDAGDVRIIQQVARGISWGLGRGVPLLAVAGDDRQGFWCGLWDGGERRLEHNRLDGAVVVPRRLAPRPGAAGPLLPGGRAA